MLNPIRKFTLIMIIQFIRVYLKRNMLCWIHSSCMSVVRLCLKFLPFFNLFLVSEKRFWQPCNSTAGFLDPLSIHIRVFVLCFDVSMFLGLNYIEIKFFTYIYRLETSNSNRFHFEKLKINFLFRKNKMVIGRFEFTTSRVQNHSIDIILQ
jgi:hypothetical protein